MIVGRILSVGPNGKIAAGLVEPALNERDAFGDQQFSGISGELCSPIPCAVNFHDVRIRRLELNLDAQEPKVSAPAVGNPVCEHDIVDPTPGGVPLPVGKKNFDFKHLQP